MANLTSNVPLVNVPFVQKDGTISEAWFLFLVQLWRRTGGATSDGELTVADVLGFERTFSPLLSGGGVNFSGDVTFASIGATTDKGSVVDMKMPVLQSSNNLSDVVYAPSSNVPFVTDKTYSSGSDFTPGTTTSLTLPGSFYPASNVWVFFDGTFQGDDQYSISSSTITFTSAIPVGVQKVYLKGIR